MTAKDFPIGCKVKTILGSVAMTVVGHGPPEDVVWCRAEAISKMGLPMPGKGPIGWWEADQLQLVEKS